jgi:hypothetical protein
MRNFLGRFFNPWDWRKEGLKEKEDPGQGPNRRNALLGRNEKKKP